MGRIILDTRLPADLDDEATSATASDWLTIQKSGEERLRRIRPLAAVPDLPASKTNTGTFSIDRIPVLTTAKLPQIVDIGSLVAVGAATTDLTTSFASQTGASINPTEAVRILVMFFFEGYAGRTSGTSQIGLEVKARKGTSQDVGPVRFACYLAGGGDGFATIGGSASWWLTDTLAAGSGNTSYSIHARRITGTTSGRRNSASVQIFTLR
jgi:hypothetical protein